MPGRHFQPCVYLLASERNGSLYLGVTSDLPMRLIEHKEKRNPQSHTARYEIDRLVWFETQPTMADAIAREKVMKGWPRQWKINVIEEFNPKWRDICPVTGVILTKI